MKFGRGGELLCLGTPSGKGYRPCVCPFQPVSLSQIQEEGPGGWQGVNPQDDSTKEIRRRDLIYPDFPHLTAIAPTLRGPPTSPVRGAQKYC